MRRKFLGTFAALAFAVGMGAGASASGPDTGRPISWGGVYVGLHLGGAWSETDWGLAYTNPGFFNASDLPGTFNFGDGSIIPGGQIGFQHQFGRWVLGAEVSASAARNTETITGVDLWQGTGVGTLETKLDWLVLATGRIGYASDRWLTYVKGGYAGARISVSSDDGVPPEFGFSDRRWHHGFTVGAGVEYMIAPGMTFGVEYNYVDLNADFSRPVINLTNGAQVGGAIANSDVDTSIHSVMARLNILFGR